MGESAQWRAAKHNTTEHTAERLTLILVFPPLRLRLPSGNPRERERERERGREREGERARARSRERERERWKREREEKKEREREKEKREVKDLYEEGAATATLANISFHFLLQDGIGYTAALLYTRSLLLL